MNVVDTSKKLLEMLAGCTFLKFLVLNDQLKELTSRGELHDEVQIFVCLNDLVDLNNIRVMQLLENLDLAADALDVFLVLNLGLFKHFHGNLCIKNGQLLDLGIQIVVRSKTEDNSKLNLPFLLSGREYPV